MKYRDRVFKIDAQTAMPELAAAIRQPGDPWRFWWLGQAGFALRYKDRLLLIDPYLSDSLADKYQHQELKHLRLMPVPIAPEALAVCDGYLSTHGHTDHMDPLTIRAIAQGPCPAFVVPKAELERGLERGIPVDRIQGIDAGETLQLHGEIGIKALPSAHERLETDARGHHRYLGYVISLGELRLYHSGDCVPYPGLEEQLAQEEIDVAFLPVNGRDAIRLSKGIAGNFSLEEAIDLCHAAGIQHFVAHHFEMFDFNTVDRNGAERILRQRAGSLNWLLPDIGVTYCIRVDDKKG